MNNLFEIEFYNVKKKKRVSVNRSLVAKRAYEKVSKAGNLVIRYSFRSVDEDGTKLSRFCSKRDYDNL
tara:strand:+ start:978 stop:1181 length:204 start_codon:yes stop_codon:yes gene_type:complete